MRIGSTVEGFDICHGDIVYVSRLVDIPQPIHIIAAPAPENPDATVEKEMPPKKKYQPVRIIADQNLSEKAWRRHRDCWVHCETTNRELKPL